MTELQTLKAKKKSGKATPEDLTRLKQLQDGEPLSKDDLAAAKKREEDRASADRKAFADKHPAKTENAAETETMTISGNAASLDPPPEHPRITQLKEALLPFTQIEAHDSRPNEFVLFTRGISITAGDVRKARKAMKL